MSPFIIKLALVGSSYKRKLLSFSGIWKDLDEEIMDDLTKDLYKHRSKDIKS